MSVSGHVDKDLKMLKSHQTERGDTEDTALQDTISSHPGKILVLNPSLCVQNQGCVKPQNATPRSHYAFGSELVLLLLCSQEPFSVARFPQPHIVAESCRDSVP